MFSGTFSSLGRMLGVGRGGEAEEERRSWGRFPCDVETTCQTTGGAAKPLAARVRNISRGGVKLVLDRPCQPGELLSLSLPGGEDLEACTVLVCVVRCAGEEQRWQLGCTFATPLDDEDLQRFGAGRGAAGSTDQRAASALPARPGRPTPSWARRTRRPVRRR